MAVLRHRIFCRLFGKKIFFSFTLLLRYCMGLLISLLLLCKTSFINLNSLETEPA